MTSHLISSCDGKTERRNQTKYQFIQEVFVSNITKIEEAQIRCTQYDFMDIFMVPTNHDKNALHPALMWNDDQCNLFLHWDLFTFNNICLWQYYFNKRCGEDDQVSSMWSQSFFYKFATSELCKCIDSKYKNLPAHHKGGVTYLFLQLKEMLFIMS